MKDSSFKPQASSNQTRSWFSTPERIAKLVYVAEIWKETPWCANSFIRGPRGGVACHNLPREIYRECGALRDDFPSLVASPNEANAASLMEPMLDGRPEFARLPGEEALQPGDLIGLWLARDVFGNRVRHDHANHLGIVLPGEWFVHVLMHKKTGLDQYMVPPWQQRIRGAWRPLEN